MACWKEESGQSDQEGAVDQSGDDRFLSEKGHENGKDDVSERKDEHPIKEEKRSDAISPKVADVLDKVMSAESGLHGNHEESGSHYTSSHPQPLYPSQHPQKEEEHGLPLLSNLYQNNYCPYPDTSYRRDSEHDASPRYQNSLPPRGGGDKYSDKFSYRGGDSESLAAPESGSFKPEEERSRHSSGQYQDRSDPESRHDHPIIKEEVELTSTPRKENPDHRRERRSHEEDESMLNGSFQEQDDSNPINPQLNSSFNDSYHSDEDSFGEGRNSGLNESSHEHLLPEDYKNYSFNGIGNNPLASPGFLGNRRYSLPPLPPSADLTSATQGSYSKTTGLYFCHLCSFSAKCKEEFDAHMSIHFEYSCPHCDYTSRTEGRLKRHIKDFHSADSEGFGTAKMQRMQTGRPKVYRCKQCSFASTTKIDFWQHSRTHIKEEKLLQCPRCPFVTEYKHHLEYHLRNHFGSKPFKCNKCNYSCVNKSMLNSHMKSHTNVYQYRCADCTYATKYCHSLKLHLKKYNHKPAAVLNADGSLPQGLEPEASGLSLLAKRGPPRGPRGPRKDKMDGFMSPMFHLPHTTMAGMPPLNGALMSPYWPLLNQLPNGMQPPPPLIPVNNMAGHMRPPHPQSSSASPEKMAKHEPGSVKCNLCGFTAETPEGLNAHVLKVHAHGENQDLFSMFGISSEALLDEHNMKAYMARQHALAKQDTTPPGGRSQSMLHVQTDQSTTPSKNSPHSWPTNPTGGSQPSANSQSLPELNYASRNGNQDKNGEPMEGADILKQMTLKFGGGNGEAPKIRKESPLDLTKPKSVSPPAYPYHIPGMPPMPFSMPMHSLTSQPVKRPLQQENDASSNENSSETAVSSPRKRSRKGKAYKLDTLCLKLQEKQNTSPYESESEDSGSEVPAEYVTETRTQPEDASPSGRGDSPGSLKGEEKGQEHSHNGVHFSAKNDFDKIHENLKILNSGLKTEAQETNGDESPDNDEQKDCPSPDDMIKQDLSKEEVADYLNPQKPVPSAIRRGAELAWKILNDAGQNGAPNGEIVLENPPNGLHPVGPDDKGIPLPHQLSLSHLHHAKMKPFRGSGSFECHYCEIAFRDCVMYTMHMGYHGYQDPYKCNMCGHCSKDKVEFFLHIARAAHS